MLELLLEIQQEIELSNTPVKPGDLPCRFNNFHDHMPNGRRACLDDDSDYDKVGKFVDEDSGELFRSKTYREFISDVKIACTIVGYEPEFLHKKWMETYARKTTDEEWFFLAAPVYRHLRKMGYNTFDLCG